jgi:cytochrome c
MKTLALAAVLLAGPALAQTQPPPAKAPDGARLWLQCRSCHELQPGGMAKTGPHLGGLFNRKIASLPGYTYSAALSAHKDETWTEDRLNQWLAAPRSFAPGNLMAFQGVPDPARRTALIAYIREQTRPPARR